MYIFTRIKSAKEKNNALIHKYSVNKKSLIVSTKNDTLNTSSPLPDFGAPKTGRGEWGNDILESVRKRGFNIGFDTEFYCINETHNYILSYQFWFSDFNCGFILDNRSKRAKLEWKELIEEIEHFIRTYLTPDNRFTEMKFNFIAHYTFAEMQSVSDIKKLWKNGSFFAVKNSIVNGRYETYTFYDKNRHKKEIQFLFRDTYLLTNDALANIAPYVNLGKIEIQHDKSRMDIFREEEFEKFLEYGIHDSVISAEFYQLFQNNMVKMGARYHRIFTMSQVGEFYFTKVLKEHNKTLAYLGYEEFVHKYLDRKGKLKAVKKSHLKLEIMDGVLGYRGGRNETYYHLIDQPDSIWYDYDIKNAYPTSMLAIKDVDWDSEHQIFSLENLDIHTMGYMLLEYEFHDTVMYPLFAITHPEKGLIFPLHGKTWVSAVEAYTAYVNGWLKSYEIKNSRIWKCRESSMIPSVVQYLVHKRSEFDKGTLWNYIYKVAINGLYGKLTQGIAERKGLDIAESVRISEVVRSETKYSKIFNPVIASYITAVSRCIVTEYMEHIHKISPDAIINVTTDGFQTRNYQMDEKLLRGEVLKLSSQFLKLREQYIGENESIMELKHLSAKGEHIAWKTRGYACQNGHECNDKMQMIAKAGNKIFGTKQEQYEQLKEYMLNADASTTLEQNRLTNPQDFIADSVDLVNYSQEVGVNMDFDWKRKVNLVWEHEQYKIIQFNTKPWRSFEEFDAFFADFKVWQKDTVPRNKIRSINDFNKFSDYQRSRKLSKLTTGHTKYTDSKEVMKGIVVYAMLLLEYRNRDIAKLLEVNVKYVEKRKATQTFKKLKSGEQQFKTISEDSDSKYGEIFDEITYLLSLDAKTDVKNVIFGMI